jgi:LmbE family N-acetylglucosaminyl deacetylase
MEEAIEIEGPAAGRPHEGKALAAVFPHSDDFSIFAGGTIAKLAKEGYRVHFIRLSDDEMDSRDLSAGETAFRIEAETREAAKILGAEKVFDFNYKNHYFEHSLLVELRHRLIFIFRLLKIDTVLSFDPWGHYEENPDHYITATAVEQACWMAGRRLDLPELSEAGIMPHFVTEKYYCARGPQVANRAVDVADFIGTKRRAIMAHRTPLDNMWSSYRSKLLEHKGASSGERGSRDAVPDAIPDAVPDLDTFVDRFLLDVYGKDRYGLDRFERFHYISPEAF